MAPKKMTPPPPAKTKAAPKEAPKAKSASKTTTPKSPAKSPQPAPKVPKPAPAAKAPPKKSEKAPQKPKSAPKEKAPKIPAPKSIRDQILATVESVTQEFSSVNVDKTSSEPEILQVSPADANSVEPVLEADEPLNQPTANIMEVGERQALEDPHELESAIEAILFASPEPIQTKKIVEALEGPDAKVVREAIERLAQKYEERRGGMKIVEVQGGWRMGSNERHSEIIYRLGSRKKRQALSPATLETLAIIAYRQPIIRAQIETIRGVECSGTIRNLLDLAMIEITGYKEVIGRPALYGTTPRFLTTFGLRSLTDLPSIRGLKEQLRQREAEDAQREMEARAKSEAEARAQAEAAAKAMEDAGIISAESSENADDEDDELLDEELDGAEKVKGDPEDDDEYDDEDDGDEYEDDDEEDEEDGDDEELDDEDEEDEFDEDDDEDEEEEEEDEEEDDDEDEK